MLESVKIQDKEKLKIHRKKLKQFQKETRCIDLQNIDNLEQEFVTYVLKHKGDTTLEEMGLVNESIQLIRNKIKEDK